MVWVTLAVTGLAVILTGLLGGLTVLPLLIWILILLGIAVLTEIIARLVQRSWLRLIRIEPNKA